jgi:hypothetical protein
MKWILFIFITGQNPYHIEFDNMKGCEYASTKVEAGIKTKTIYGIYTVCFPKALP